MSVDPDRRDDAVRVLSRYLNFRCLATKGAFVTALTGVHAGDRRVVAGFSIATLAGVRLVQYIPVTPAMTFDDIRAELARRHPDFPRDNTAFMYKHAGGTALVRASKYATPRNILALTGTLVAIPTKLHVMRRTSAKQAYDFTNGILCPRCLRAGPGKYTGSEYCTDCHCCGTCCIAVDDCSVDLAVAVDEFCRADDAAETEFKNQRLAQYKLQFYEWQLAIFGRSVHR